MEFRPLGRSGLKIAPFVLGANVFGWNINERTSHSILDVFVDAGFNAIDTADNYSRWITGHTGGESETIIGNWVKRSGKRNSLIIATKVGADMGEGICVRKHYILRSVETSLRRLQTDHIDLYQTHFDDETTPVEETLDAYTTLIAQGKIRAFGASNLTPERFEASLAVSKRLGLPRYESLQPLYNLYNRNEFETLYESTCLREGIGVITYFSLAAGFLTGKYPSLEATMGNPVRAQRLARYANLRGFAILNAMREVASRHHATLAQIALAWLIARPAITAPIASATSIAQLTEIMTASKLKLTSDDIKTLDDAAR